MECSSRVRREKTLTYAVGTPHASLPPGAGLAAITTVYQWKKHVVADPSQWAPSFVFDLALDSRGRAHICFPGVEIEDSALVGDVKHAVWNDKTQQFATMAVAAFTDVMEVAIAIPKDDSLHIAFSDGTSVQYATRAGNKGDLDPFQPADVDTRAPAVMFDLSIAVGSGGQIGISYIFLPAGVNSAGGFQLIFAEKRAGVWVLDPADPGPWPPAPWPRPRLWGFSSRGRTPSSSTRTELPRRVFSRRRRNMPRDSNRARHVGNERNRVR